MKKYTLITGACINTGVAIVEKFAKEGKNVVFTGRNEEKVRLAEERYKFSFPNVQVKGYVIDALAGNGSVNEETLTEMFADFDRQEMFV